MRLLENNVLIKFIETRGELTATDSGIILVSSMNKETKSALRQAYTGEVLAVGPDVERSPVDNTPFVKVGDIVLCERNVGTKVMIEGERCYLYRDDHILALYIDYKPNEIEVFDFDIDKDYEH
jgi:co-chaperonin GroES (HSP10)